MGKKVKCDCGKLLGVRDVIDVNLPVLEDCTKTITLECRCGLTIIKEYKM